MNILQAILALSIGTSAVHTQAADCVTDPGNLMVVLRESAGTNTKEMSMTSLGNAKAKLADGKEVEINPAWFTIIGDMHIRFVCDSPASMSTLTSDEFAALKMKPEEAVRFAVDNIKRVYGSPKFSPFHGGLMLVSGKLPDVDSSYFLDSSFWQHVLKKYPGGVVVGVPKRGVLLFAPMYDDRAVAILQETIGPLFVSSENMRVSSALYLFKNNRWSVFQNPFP